MPIFLALFILLTNNMVIEKVKAKKKNSKIYRYLFDEMNSGWHLKFLASHQDTDDKLKYNYCIIEARSAEEAINIFQDYFSCDIKRENKNSCPCCWERFWYISTDNPEEGSFDGIYIYNRSKEDIDETIEIREQNWWRILYIENEE